MQLRKEELFQSWKTDRSKERKRFWITLGVVFALFLFCLCFRYHAYDYDDKFCPVEYAKSYGLAIRLLFAHMFDTPLWYRRMRRLPLWAAAFPITARWPSCG